MYSVVKFGQLRMGINVQVAVFLLLCSICHVKPHNTDRSDACPKFDLDEQLLARLVRLEHTSGVMIESFKEISTQVKTELEPIKMEFEEMRRRSSEEKHTFETFKTGFEKIKRDAVEQGQEINDQLETIGQQATEQLHTMKTEFGELKQNVTELSHYLEEALSEGKVRIQDAEAIFEKSLQSQLVRAKTFFYDEVESFGKFVSGSKDAINEQVYAFSVARISNTSPRAHEPLVFVDVNHEEVSVYDVTSGKFTSPVNGTFAFSFSVCAAAGKAMSIQLVVNGRAVSGAAGYSKGNPESVSSDAVVALSRGDEVWVETDNGLYENDGQLCWSQFSGHILH